MIKLSNRLENIECDRFIRETFIKLSHAKHIFILGAGARGKYLARFLLNRGIDFDAFLVTERFYSEGHMIKICGQNKKLKCYEHEMEKNKDDITIILGISHNLIDMNIFNNRNIKDVIPLNLGIMDDYLISKDFYMEYADKFDKTYELLADNYSRDCMYANFLGRLTGKDISFKPSAWSGTRYIFDEFMIWKKTECYVDCGAYVGDSVEEFLTKMPLQTVKEFSVYAWEPDNENFEVLQKKYENNQRVKTLCLGAYSHKTQLHFSDNDGELSAISVVGSTMIEADSIDNILGDEKATFIKMDIEGSELEALKGAKGQIISHTPRLAICVYHKKEDLYSVPELIMSYNANYSFYLRPHLALPTELVLFAIPEK
ncbi:MAG: FkbM family methyltransferase [Dorea sp.]|nr:FkbM family methyltransferase [Dorea sp.]